MERHPDSPAVATARRTSPLEPDLTPLPQPENALVAQPVAAEAPDDPGFDPTRYKWVPVLRKPRKDGFTPQRQVAFIRALAETGCVEHAAQAAGMSVASCYRLRHSPGAEAFAAAWTAALGHAARRLVDVAFDRAFNGSQEPVFDRDGRRVGRRMRQNDRLLMFLLRAYMPERFRHAHRAIRMPREALPPPPEPLGLALDRLEPPPPPDPHLLMSPDELESALDCADMLDGELPRWHRGHGDADPQTASILGDEFERALEAAKSEAADYRARRFTDEGEEEDEDEDEYEDEE